MNYYEALKEVKNIEKNSGVYDVTLFNIPIWRIVRSETIENHLNRKYKFEKRNNTKRQIKLNEIISSYFCSFAKIIKFYLKGNKYEYVFLAFPRLQKYNNQYWDKFTDPVIDRTENLKEFLIIQRSQSGKHFKPRYHNKSLIKNDFIEITSLVSSIICFPFTFFIFYKKINSLSVIVKNVFDVSQKFPFQLSIKLGYFFIARYLYSLLFRKLMVKHIFVVNRDINSPVVSAAKKINAKTYEFQHGITLDWSILYSGKYSEYFDTDYFLSFGAFWKGRQFGIPIDKILNIGWAYKDIVRSNINKTDNQNVLVVSEPLISKTLINAVIELAKEYSEFVFKIRPHPQERISENQQKKIVHFNNIDICSNDVDSNIALLKYKWVIGVNSSVLFEAASVGKPVGCLNFGGCITNATKLDSPFTILNSITDFSKLVYEKSYNKNNYNNFYSDFNTQWLDEITGRNNNKQ